jgi:hypothetical protein
VRLVTAAVFAGLIVNNLRLSVRINNDVVINENGGGYSDGTSSNHRPVPVAVDDESAVQRELMFHIMTREDTIDNLSIDCGGCTVLWSLRGALEAHKFEVTTFGCPTIEMKRRSHEDNRTIVVIYPEVDDYSCDDRLAVNIDGIVSDLDLEPVSHNGTNATSSLHANAPTTVSVSMIHVRWMLAPVGYHCPYNITDGWGDDDLIMSYATSTGPNLSTENVLQVIRNPLPGDVTDISKDGFYNMTNRTGKIAWMMRKGDLLYNLTTLRYIHDRPGYDITELTKGLQDPSILLQYEYFVTYDPYTYWSWYAAMLGTVSVVFPYKNHTKAEWAKMTFLGSYLQAIGQTDIPGVAYGWEDDEIDYARRTMHELRDFLLRVKDWGANVTVPRFVRDCYRFRHGERLNLESALLKRTVYPLSATTTTTTSDNSTPTTSNYNEDSDVATTANSSTTIDDKLTNETKLITIDQ